MNIGVVIGLYDSAQKPFFVFSHVVPHEVAQKICQKALAVQKVLSGEPSDNEGIFSLASNMVSVFIHFTWYFHPSKNQLLPLIIAFTTPINDQRILYKFFPQFSILSKEIKSDLIELLNSTKRLEDFIRTAPKYIEEHYNFDAMMSRIRKLQLEEDKDVNGSTVVVGVALSGKNSLVDRPITFLNETIPKNLDQIILPLITGSKIVIIVDASKINSEEPSSEMIKLVNAAIATLRIFAPHRMIKVWKNYDTFPSKKSISRFNVFCLDHGLRKQAKKENWVVIDLIERKIHGGEENRFCSELFKEILEAEGRSPTHAKVVARKKVDWLLFHASTFLEPDLEPDQVKKRVENFLPYLEKDVLVIIARLIQRANPSVSNYIMKKLSLRKRLLGF